MEGSTASAATNLQSPPRFLRWRLSCRNGECRGPCLLDRVGCRSSASTQLPGSVEFNSVQRCQDRATSGQIARSGILVSGLIERLEVGAGRRARFSLEVLMSSLIERAGSFMSGQIVRSGILMSGLIERRALHCMLVLHPTAGRQGSVAAPDSTCSHSGRTGGEWNTTTFVQPLCNDQAPTFRAPRCRSECLPG